MKTPHNPLLAFTITPEQHKTLSAAAETLGPNSALSVLLDKHQRACEYAHRARDLNAALSERVVALQRRPKQTEAETLSSSLATAVGIVHRAVKGDPRVAGRPIARVLNQHNRSVLLLALSPQGENVLGQLHAAVLAARGEALVTGPIGEGEPLPDLIVDVLRRIEGEDEDARDLRAADRVRKEGEKPIPAEDVFRSLGLDAEDPGADPDNCPH